MENYRETDNEMMPIETPQQEIMNVLDAGDPDLMLAMLERKAELAPRFNKAIQSILISQTYPNDWQEFNGKMALSSAGAERVSRIFGIKITDVKSKREDFTDTQGKGFRYVFEGNAHLNDRTVYAQGSYSTRDKFLGFANGEWRPIEDVNEGNIRNAAYHIFYGNAVKALLGLRHIPIAEFQKLMGSAGANPADAGKTSYNSGGQGGTDANDTKHQQELSKLLVDMANACEMVAIDSNGECFIAEASEGSDPLEVAKASCKALTTFKGKDGNMVDGIDSVKKLKGQRLTIALSKVKKLKGL